MKQHALSKVFPDLPEDDLVALADDILEHGLREPITMYEGEVLDGWGRYRACQIVGVHPRQIDYRGSNPVAYVKSKNWYRRHLNASQRALTEVQLSQWVSQGGDRSKPSKEGLKTAAEMADEANVSVATIERAKVVAIDGAAVVKQAVKEGEISVTKAAKVARLPKKKQRQAMQEEQEPKEHAPDMANELEIADKEIRRLQTLVESLSKSDLAKEVKLWQEKFAALEGRLQQEMTTCAEARKQATYATELLAKIRKAIKVEKNSEILAKLK